MSAMEMRERLRPFGISFDKSLDDLIKGIRAISNDQEKLAKFYEKSIQECKRELKSSDGDLKSTAILKLSYLEMYGFDMSWCSFDILEVMASSKFQHKRIGYLAAIQILQRQNNDDALMLMTNLLKKDLNSNQYIETSLAISGIAAIVSKELALDICDDLVKMLNHSKPLIRKKTVLAMYKMFLKNPEALVMYYDRIVDKLTDNDRGVVSATVNVICELALANPANYIELAPRLYSMLTSTNNNWMLIRLLRLFSSLSVTEPRLKNKLFPPIVELLKTTSSLSLKYECINTILNGDMLSEDDQTTAELIIQELVAFLSSRDQNLKYVGLLAFVKTCKIHQSLIQQHGKLLLTSIYDNDITIRETSLEIINSLVNENNVTEIVSRLTVQLLPPTEQAVALKKINEKMMESAIRQSNKKFGNSGDDSDSDEDEDEVFMYGSIQQPITAPEKYKSQLIYKIIEICSMNNYSNIPTFKWYLTVLNDLLNINRFNKISNVDMMITQQLLDVGLKVPGIRPTLVELCLKLCGFTGEHIDLSTFKKGLQNCMWIISEYYDEYLQSDDIDSDVEEDDDEEGNTDTPQKTEKITPLEIIKILNTQKSLENLGYSSFDKTLSIYLLALTKIFAKFCATYGINEWSLSQFEFVKSLLSNMIDWIKKFENSPNFEVQERALSLNELLKLLLESFENEIQIMITEDNQSRCPPVFLSQGFNPLFLSSKIIPVTKRMQQNSKLPDDLDLDEAFDEEALQNFSVLQSQHELENIELVDDCEQHDDTKEDYMEMDDNANQLSDPIDETLTIGKVENDPYYLADESNGLQTDQTKLTTKKIQKKPHKVKKPKKEKMIILDADDDGDVFSTDTEPVEATTASRGKFHDVSQLAGIDLKQKDSVQKIADEYVVKDSPPTEMTEDFQTTIDGFKIGNTMLSTPAVTKKPKKKVKKKVAVIE